MTLLTGEGQGRWPATASLGTVLSLTVVERKRTSGGERPRGWAAEIRLKGKVGVIKTYARFVALILLVVAVTGVVLLSWGAGEVLYHAGLGLLFAYAGFGTVDTAVARGVVGGLGVLVIVVGAVELLALWLSPSRLVLYPHDITCLAVGVGSLLAARYLSRDKSGL